MIVAPYLRSMQLICVALFFSFVHIWKWLDLIKAFEPIEFDSTNAMSFIRSSKSLTRVFTTNLRMFHTNTTELQQSTLTCCLEMIKHHRNYCQQRIVFNFIFIHVSLIFAAAWQINTFNWIGSRWPLYYNSIIRSIILHINLMEKSG